MWKQEVALMEQFFKSIIDMDIAPIVVCSLEHKIIYMNPAAAESYKKSGGYGPVSYTHLM